MLIVENYYLLKKQFLHEKRIHPLYVLLWFSTVLGIQNRNCWQQRRRLKIMNKANFQVIVLWLFLKGHLVWYQHMAHLNALIAQSRTSRWCSCLFVDNKGLVKWNRRRFLRKIRKSRDCGCWHGMGRCWSAFQQRMGRALPPCRCEVGAAGAARLG